MYKEITSELTNQVVGIYDEEKNLYIPIDPINADYQAYLESLEA